MYWLILILSSTATDYQHKFQVLIKKNINLYSTAIGLRNALEKHVMKNMAVPYADKPRNVASLTFEPFLLLYNEYMALKLKRETTSLTAIPMIPDHPDLQKL